MDLFTAIIGWAAIVVIWAVFLLLVLVFVKGGTRGQHPSPPSGSHGDDQERTASRRSASLHV